MFIKNWSMDMAEEENISHIPVEEWIKELEFEATDQVKIPSKLADQVIGQALQNKEASPYLEPVVQMRRLVREVRGGPAPTPPTPSPRPPSTAPATTGPTTGL